MIQFLIDEDVTPRLRDVANTRGYLAHHVQYLDWKGRKDFAIRRRMIEENLTLVTGNWKDFRPMLQREEAHPGAISLPDVPRADQIRLFEAALNFIERAEPPLDMVNCVLVVAPDGRQRRGVHDPLSRLDPLPSETVPASPPYHPRMRLKYKPVAILLAVVGAAAAAWVGYSRHVSSPQYALGEIGRAIERRDRMAFEHRVDVPAMARSAVDDLVAEAMADEMAGASDEARAGLALGLGVLENAKPLLVSSLRSTLLEAVEKGQLADMLLPDSIELHEQHFANMARSQLGSPVRFGGVGKVRRNGRMATAELLMRDDPADTTLALRLRMDRGDDGWRVVAFDNLREYLDESDRVHDAIVATVNRRIEQRIAGTVQIGAPAVRIEPGLYGAEVMYVEVPVKNVGRDTVMSVRLVLEQWGQPVGDNDLNPEIAYEPLAPGETRTASAMVVYSYYNAAHSTVRHGTVTPRVARVLVTRKNGREYLEKLSGWEAYLDQARDAKEPSPPPAAAARASVS